MAHKTAPERIPVHPSSRKVGVELEIDPTSDVDLPRVDGWATHSDGSLSYRGSEYVMEPPRAANAAGPVIKALCSKLNGNIKVRKAGAMHVHVQAHDYSTDDATYLANLYSYFQKGINTLVGNSRIDCKWCKPYEYPVTRSQIESKWNLRDLRSSRSDAKSACTSRYSTINMCMLRVRNENNRTVEFRQGSVTKKSVNVEGWVAFLVSLVEATKQRIPFTEFPRTFDGLVAFLRSYEAANPSVKDVADWVQWRHDYMNAQVDDQVVMDAMSVMPRKIGPFTLSRRLDTNLSVAIKILQRANELGLCRRVSAGVYVRSMTAVHVAQEWDSLLQKSKEAERRQIESREVAASVLPTLPAA